MTEYLYKAPESKGGHWVLDEHGPYTSREAAIEAFLCIYQPHYTAGYVAPVLEYREMGQRVLVDRNSVTHFFWAGTPERGGPGYIINRTDLANARQK